MKRYIFMSTVFLLTEVQALNTPHEISEKIKKIKKEENVLLSELKAISKKREALEDTLKEEKNEESTLPVVLSGKEISRVKKEDLHRLDEARKKQEKEKAALAILTAEALYVKQAINGTTINSLEDEEKSISIAQKEEKEKVEAAKLSQEFTEEEAAKKTVQENTKTVLNENASETLKKGMQETDKEH